MSLIVSNIVKGVNEQNSNVNSSQLDDWASQRTMIASN